MTTAATPGRRSMPMPADVAALILRDVAAGATIAAAAKAHGYSARAVQRRANRRADFARQLEKAKRAGAKCRGPQQRPDRERPVEHGTPAGYRRGCRCGGCTAANTAHVHRWRVSRRQQRMVRRAV